MISADEYKRIRYICKAESRNNEHWEDFAQDYAVKILEGKKVMWCKQFVWRSYQKQIYKLLGGSTELLPMIEDTNNCREFTELKDYVVNTYTINRKRLPTNTLKYFNLFNTGMYYSEIGKELGVSKQCVGEVLTKLFNTCKERMENDTKITHQKLIF